jgi:hypothetical protein
MRIFSLILAFVLFEPDPVPAPKVIPREKGSIGVSNSGKTRRWTAEWTMEPATEKGLPAVHFTEVGRGQYSGFTEPVSWTTDALWSADRVFHPLRFEKTVKNSSGKVIATERKIFDPAKGTVDFERKREGYAAETRREATPPDTLAPEGIVGIMRFLPFDHWQTTKVHLFSSEPKLYEMKIEMKGREHVTTPAGDFDCYKIELVPQLGALNLVKGLFPKAIFWFTVAPPHFWVRYEGPESGAGTPRVVMELKTYQPERATN